MTLPTDFAAALAADEQASASSASSPNSMQRYHAGNITAAKSADTRQRRMDKAIALFRARQERYDAQLIPAIRTFTPSEAMYKHTARPTAGKPG